MKKHSNIIQGSLEWHEIKWGKIGGSTSKGLFVKSDTLFLDILSQKIEDFELEDNFSNSAMEHGTENEPIAREYLEKYLNVKFEVPGWLQSEQNELLGISPDGLTSDNKIACEIKCLGRKAHTEIIYTNEIPLDKINQLIHYFTVNPDLEKLYFIAFRKESVKQFIKCLTMDSLVNIGTNAKPNIVTIRDAKDYSIEMSNILKAKIDKAITDLTAEF